MSLTASYFDNCINYKVCFQHVSVDEYNELYDFLTKRFDKNSYDILYPEEFNGRYSAIWIKFYNEQEELKFKLLWNSFH